MFYDKQILSFIQSKLNTFASNGNYDLVFDGEVGFYDEDWIKEHLGTNTTPFVLTDLGFSKEANDDYVGKYSIGMLAKSKKREDYFEIIDDTLESIMNKTSSFEGLNMVFSVTRLDVGEDITSGNGFGDYSFEILINIAVRILESGYNGTQRVITIDGVNIRHKGIKIEHGKMEISNIDPTPSGTIDNVNRLLNNGMLVIEAYIDSDKVKSLLDVNKIGIANDIEIKFGNLSVVDEIFDYDGYMISNEQGNSLTVFLYFSLKRIRNTITINGITVPIISDGITMGVVSEPFRTPNSNITKNVYIGKARSYAFVVAETYNSNAQTLIDELYAQLLGDDEKAPLYNVTITFNGKAPITKRLLLSEIQKSSKDGKMITLQFMDGVDL